VVTWTALLGGCRWSNDIERAERVAENIIKLDPHEASTYLLLANVYASAGCWDEVKAVRMRMESNGIKKIPGQTWIEINEKVNSFLAGDKSHELANEIQTELKKDFNEMREFGYIPNTKFIMHSMNEEEKEHHLCSHSEKLAIGLGLISTPPGTPLLITKNLRICPDCHSATKAISKIRNREITVRDSNQFHHFKNGECEGYW
jgi:pentatricopeptide repeat protein